MNKEYTSLGLMSGTSGDGIDASIIKSDGISKYEVLFNKYYKYQDDIYQNIHSIKEKINKQEQTKTVIIRVEQLYPFPKELILESIKDYKEAYFVWCQEEPQNMGAWFFVFSEISEILEKNNFKNKKLYYSGRKSSASTATGLFKRHVIEQEELINSLFRDFKNE